jgi:hypothetical protein
MQSSATHLFGNTLSQSQTSTGNSAEATGFDRQHDNRQQQFADIAVFRVEGLEQPVSRSRLYLKACYVLIKKPWSGS